MAGQNLIKALTERDPAAKISRFEKAFEQGTFLRGEAVDQLVNSLGGLNGVEPTVREQYLLAAQRELSRVVNRAPSDARGWSALGNLYARVGDLEKRIEALEKAYELAPKKQVIAFDLAFAYQDADRSKEALLLAKETLDLAPRFAEGRRYYAYLLSLNKRQEEAAEILAYVDPVTGVPIEPDERFINLYIEAGRFEEVVKLWQKKVEENSDNVQFRFSLAAAYLKAGERAKAIEELEVAKKINAEVIDQADYLIREIKNGKNPLSN